MKPSWELNPSLQTRQGITKIAEMGSVCLEKPLVLENPQKLTAQKAFLMEHGMWMIRSASYCQKAEPVR